MDPVSVSVIVSAPRERVFAYLEDVANRPQFTGHYLTEWHLLRADSVGRGAGARFRSKSPKIGRFKWGDLTLAEVEAPARIVETGRTGKDNRIRTLSTWRLDPAAHGSTRVTLTLQTAPKTLGDKLLEGFGARRSAKRNGERAMKRMRDILEGGRAGGERITVAGG